MRIKRGLFEFLSLFISLGFISLYSPRPAEAVMPIGQIQGREMISPLLNQKVTFRGIVTGVIEDQNTRGRVYYTIFAQDLPGFEDGDPLSSDGIAIFLGRNKPQVATGDIIYVSGKVTEYYGLTEIDDTGLWLTIESRNNPLPLSVELDPPAGMQESETYFERLEGMFVSVPRAVTVGPTHEGCGMAIIREDTQLERVFRRNINDPAGMIINVINASDVDCTGLPPLAIGDRVEGLMGPLTFHFDRYKIIQQNLEDLEYFQADHQFLSSHIPLTPSQVSLASFNLDDYFDVVDDTGDIAEPKFNEVELARKQEKLTSAIADVLSCPTLIGVQEVENELLLMELSDRLIPKCGFSYAVSHLDAPDVRGSDLALLSDPRRVNVLTVSQHQSCSILETGVFDPTIQCPNGEEPLFSRPPLLVNVDIDGQSLSIFINHFKSKRGGELETAPRRLAQAQHLLDLVSATMAPDRDTAIVVLGDFNDYDKSSVMEVLLESGILIDGLERVPESERYSYIFDGASQLVDWILVTPWLKDRIVSANIFHINADYPYQLGLSLNDVEIHLRTSDHDIPFVVLDFAEDFDQVVENPAIEESSENLIEGNSATAAIPSPIELDPALTPTASTEDILEGSENITELPLAEGEATNNENTELIQKEDGVNRYKPDWTTVLAGSAVIIAVGLVFMWLRHTKASG
jgi:predicted extracellular nuclease